MSANLENCNKVLREKGKPYPRTCKVCGLFETCSLDIKNDAQQELCLQRDNSLEEVFKLVRDEVERAVTNWPPFNSAHEGYAIILEEVDELWDEVKLNESNRDLQNMKTEAIQVAATAIKFVMSI